MVNRERCFVDFNISIDAIESGDKNLTQYVDKQSLQKLGLMYAERYATKTIRYRLLNIITGDTYLSESTEVIDNTWVVDSVVYRYKL